MSVISRKFSACPVRTAANTWSAIVDVIAGASGTARVELLKIEGIAASVISDETPKKNAITIIGTGPRLRIYCLYDEEGSIEDANESSINWNLFEGDWSIYLPVEKEELTWVTKALAAKGSRFKAYEAGTKLTEEEEDKNTSQQEEELTIDISKL